MPDWGENPGVTRKSESSQPHRLYIRPQSVSIRIHDVVSYLELLLALPSCQRTSLLTSSRTPVRYEISGSATERDTQHRYRPPITSLPLYSKQRSFLWSALQTCAAHGLHGNLVHNCHNLSPAYSQSIPSPSPAFASPPGKSISRKYIRSCQTNPEAPTGSPDHLHRPFHLPTINMKLTLLLFQPCASLSSHAPPFLLFSRSSPCRFLMVRWTRAHGQSP